MFSAHACSFKLRHVCVDAMAYEKQAGAVAYSKNRTWLAHCSPEVLAGSALLAIANAFG